jgi:signal transduction histidine kinase/ActR/RegA family two-component response regulator
MEVIEVVRLAAALSSGMIGALYLLVWRHLRLSWAAFYAAAFLLMTISVSFDTYIQPSGNRPNPISTGLAQFTAWFMVLAMNRFGSIPPRVGRVISIAVGLMAVVITGLAILERIPRIAAFGAIAAVSILMTIQALFAFRHEHAKGFGLVVIAMLIYPLAMAAAASGVMPLPSLRYAGIVPAVLTGMSVLTTGLLRAQHRSESAERELRALNESLEHRVAQRTDELREAVQRLDAANQELTTLNASRTRLMASACHDLRQPTHALGMLAEVALQKVPETARQPIEDIRQCSTSLSNMLDMLLDMTQLEADRYKPSRQAVRLEDLLNELHLQFAPQAQRKGLAFSVDATTAGVESDPHLLRRILLNLVSNGIKYTSVGFVHVSVQDEGHQLKVQVSDSGPGIPDDKVDSVFADFVRLDTAQGIHGLGIGLPIVKRAAALLGHELQLHSQVGQGTTFTLILPSAIVPTQAPEAAPTTAGQGQLIGIVENDEMILTAVSQLLEGRGFQVASARNALELQESLARRGSPSPDLLISDLHLGRDQNGMDLIGGLKQSAHWQRTAFVLVTGDLDAEVATQASTLGVAVAYKPVQPRKLLSLMDALLKRSIGSGPMPASA